MQALEKALEAAVPNVDIVSYCENHFCIGPDAFELAPEKVARNVDENLYEWVSCISACTNAIVNCELLVGGQFCHSFSCDQNRGILLQRPTLDWLSFDNARNILEYFKRQSMMGFFEISQLESSIQLSAATVVEI